jgi:hypothetical protein
MRYVTTHILYARLLPLFADYAYKSEAIDILEINSAAGLDFVSAFFFGFSCSTNFLLEKEKRKRWLDAYLKSHSHDSMLWIQELPNLTAWLTKLGVSVVPKSGIEAVNELSAWCLDMCVASDKVLVNLQNGNENPRGDFPEVYHQLKMSMAKEATNQKSYVSQSEAEIEIASELLDHLGATMLCSFDESTCS